MVIKQIVFIIEAYYFVNYVQILPKILLSRLTPCAEEIIVEHQRGLRRNILVTNLIICVRQILEKKWEYIKVVHQLFIDFKKA